MRININQERKKYLFLLETPFNPDSALDLVVKQNFSINSSAHGKF
ncbi:hypothetical protein FLACOL_01453 [Flavobacterium columnare]|uniref:Uncharacterized protein n=1 Tax=Flavobacterium columnare TaxID=996 RepID=A0A2N9PAS0_9FLAO|nr:hypothetical protein FLACOL_01453 [Flavobacterium columnare]